VHDVTVTQQQNPKIAFLVKVPDWQLLSPTLLGSFFVRRGGLRMTDINTAHPPARGDDMFIPAAGRS